MEKIEQLENKMDRIITEINNLNQKFEDHFLTNEERKLIDETMKEKEEGILVSASEVF